MKKKLLTPARILLACLLIAVVGLVGCSSGGKDADTSADEQGKEAQVTTQESVELQIFAANSLSKALEEVQDLYMKEHEGITFADTQFLSSGELVESLKGGAYADLLITASKGTMDTAEEEALVDPATRFDMFSNELVIVSKEGSGLSDITLQDIADGTYTVAVGDDAVPAGNYAAQALSTVGAYDDGSGKTGKDITGKEGSYVGISPALESSVGNVCKKAEAGEVDLAIVYSSDVYRFGGVEIVGTISADTHKSIIYPAAICADSKYAAETQEFVDFALSNPEALKIWQKWGFELIG